MTQIFAVYDAVAERYVDPWPAMNVGVALRGFEEACAREGSDFMKHPEDYSLWLVGEWDGELGLLTGVSPVVKVAMATTFISQRPLHPDTDHVIPNIIDRENGQIEEIGT